MSAKPRRKLLTDVIVEEVSTVDLGGNQHADLVLWKRALVNKDDDGMTDAQRKRVKELMEKEGMSEKDALASVMRGDSRKKAAGSPGINDDSTGESEMDSNEELQKRLGDLAEEVAALKKNGESRDAELAKALGNVDSLTAAIQNHGFTVEKSDDGFKVTAPAEPEYIQVGDQQIAKGSMPDAAIELLKKQAEENAELRKAHDDAILAKRVDTEVGMLAGDVATRAALLKAVDGIADEEVRKNVAEVFKAANAAHEIALREKGHSHVDEDPDAPSAQIETMAKALFEKGGHVSIEAARRAVLKSPEGRKLRAAARNAD